MKWKDGGSDIVFLTSKDLLSLTYSEAEKGKQGRSALTSWFHPDLILSEQSG